MFNRNSFFVISLLVLVFLSAFWAFGDYRTEPAKASPIGDIECSADKEPVTELPGPYYFQDCEMMRVISSIKSPKGHAAATVIDGFFLAVYSGDGGGSLNDGGIDLWDISNPRSPVLVKRYDDAITKGLREAHSYGLAVKNGRKYIAFQSIKGAQIWDFTDPMKAFFLTEIEVPGVNGGDYTGVWWLSWQFPYLYLAGTTNGLFVVDTSDLDNPSIVNRVPNVEMGGINPSVVYAAGTKLVGMEAMSGRLFSMDISQPTEPRLTDLHDGIPGYSGLFIGDEFITVSGDIGIGGNGDVAGMYRYKIDANGKISFLGRAGENLEDGGYGSFQDGYFFAGYSDSFAKFELASTKQVARGVVKNTKSDQDYGIIFGNIAFVSDDHGVESSFIAHQLDPDKTPPSVIWASPHDQEMEVSPAASLGLSFSDQIMLESLSSSNFVLKDVDGQTVDGDLSVQGGIVNFTPRKSLLPKMNYRLSVTGMFDFSGNVMQPYTGSFTTGDMTKKGNGRCSLSPRRPTLVGHKVKFTISSNDDLSKNTIKWSFGDKKKAVNLEKNAFNVFYEAGRYVVQAQYESAGKEVFCSTVHVVYENPVKATPNKSSGMISAIGNIYTANPDNNSVTMVKMIFPESKVKCEIKVGVQPQTIAFVDDDERQLWVTNQFSHTISILHSNACRNLKEISLKKGSMPYGIVYSKERDVLYVTLQGTGELLEFSPNGSFRRKLALSQNIRDISLTADGKTLFVSKFISDGDRGLIYKVDAVSLTVLEEIWVNYNDEPDTAVSGAGIPNYIGPVSISPDGKLGLIPSKKDNVFRSLVLPGKTADFENTVRSLVSAIDISTGLELTDRRNDLNDRALARDIAFSPFGDLYFVVSQSSNLVDVYETATNQFVSSFEVGDGPDAILLDENGARVFVRNMLSRDIHVFDALDLTSGQSNSVDFLGKINLVKEELLPPNILRGKKIFYNANNTKMSQDGYLSCAVCHIDGSHDGQNWRLGNKGVRNTQSLIGIGYRKPKLLNWSGNLDEIQDFENEIRTLFMGEGFMSEIEFLATKDPLANKKAGRSQELDDLAAFIFSLKEPVRSPFRTVSGTLNADALKGRKVFESMNCQGCHSGKTFSDGKLHFVHHSLGKSENVEKVLTPSLIGVWATAPYFHDGSKKTLKDLLNKLPPQVKKLDKLSKKYLVEFLKSIDKYEPAIN